MPKVALVKGMVRYDNVYSALKMISKDVQDKLSSSTHIVIKPDLLHIHGCSNLQSAHVDATKAILDFIEELTNKRITIAEGSFSGEDVFHRHDFHDLLKDYSVRFLNLNNDDTLPIKLQKTVNVSKTLLKSDFRISLPVLKRDMASLLGSIPNIILGAVSGQDKANFYADRSFARNTAELFKLFKPQLSVFDGFDAVKTIRKIKSSLAMASTDAIAADTVAARILKLKNVKYLSHFKKSKIELLGNKPSDF